MNEEILQQIFAEIFSELEQLDRQCSALLQFLKSKGIAAEEELAPFLKRAGDASSVRWLALRLRIDALISSASKPPGEERETTPTQGSRPTAKPSNSSETGQEQPQRKRENEEDRATARAESSETNHALAETAKGGSSGGRENQEKKDHRGVQTKEDHEKEDHDNAAVRERTSSSKTRGNPDGYSDDDLRESKLSDPPFFSTALHSGKANASPHSTSSEPQDSGEKSKSEGDSEAA